MESMLNTAKKGATTPLPIKGQIWARRGTPDRLTVNYVCYTTETNITVYFGEKRFGSRVYRYANYKKFARMVKHQKYELIDINPGDLVLIDYPQSHYHNLIGEVLPASHYFYSGIGTFGVTFPNIRGSVSFPYEHLTPLCNVK